MNSSINPTIIYEAIFLFASLLDNPCASIISRLYGLGKKLYATAVRDNAMKRVMNAGTVILCIFLIYNII